MLVNVGRSWSGKLACLQRHLQLHYWTSSYSTEHYKVVVALWHFQIWTKEVSTEQWQRESKFPEELVCMMADGKISNCGGVKLGLWAWEVAGWWIFWTRAEQYHAHKCDGISELKGQLAIPRPQLYAWGCLFTVQCTCFALFLEINFAEMY